MRESLIAWNSLYGEYMGILAWLIVGMITGWFTGKVKGSRAPAALRDLILGGIGAMMGGLVAAASIGATDMLDGINIITMLAACVGAVFMVMFVKALNGRQVAAKNQ